MKAGIGGGRRNSGPEIPIVPSRYFPTHLLRLHQDCVLDVGPIALFQARVEVVKPPLPALLPDPARDAIGNVRPLGELLGNRRDDNPILLTRPSTFHQPRLEYFLPSLQTLNIGPLAFEELRGDGRPVLGASLLDGEAELLVLGLGPPAAFLLARLLFFRTHYPQGRLVRLRRGRCSGALLRAEVLVEPARERRAVVEVAVVEQRAAAATGGVEGTPLVQP